MQINQFFYKIFLIGKSDAPAAFLGTAFPITPNGGLLTCRHVVEVEKRNDEIHIAIFDNELNLFKPINQVLYSSLPGFDLAFLPNALNRTKQAYFPILSPEKLIIGEDIYSFGYYSIDKDPNQVTQGYFAGHIVNISPMSNIIAPNITLPYPLLEGMSGSPVLTYHNGPKVVGVGCENRQHRISISEVLEYKDSQREYKESINRIVEYGLAYHPISIMAFLSSININDFLVSEKGEQIPGLE